MVFKAHGGRRNIGTILFTWIILPITLLVVSAWILVQVFPNVADIEQKTHSRSEPIDVGWDDLYVLVVYIPLVVGYGVAVIFHVNLRAKKIKFTEDGIILTGLIGFRIKDTILPKSDIQKMYMQYKSTIGVLAKKERMLYEVILYVHLNNKKKYLFWFRFIGRQKFEELQKVSADNGYVYTVEATDRVRLVI